MGKHAYKEGISYPRSQRLRDTQNQNMNLGLFAFFFLTSNPELFFTTPGPIIVLCSYMPFQIHTPERKWGSFKKERFPLPSDYFIIFPHYQIMSGGKRVYSGTDCWVIKKEL